MTEQKVDEQAGAFEGVRVLDLSQGVAGPYAAMLFARHGADVVKLEPTGDGCWSRQLGRSTGDHTAHSLVVHRGKRSLSVNLKSPDGLAAAERLASRADLVIQNYRVGKIDRFGLDWATLSARDRRLVYVSVTGFGPGGPRVDYPATDSVMQAYTGVMAINRDERGKPQRINMLAVDFATGLYAFQAASAALYRQLRTGLGQHVQTSLLESALVFQEAAIIESALQGERVEAIGMPVGTFETRDGWMSINARRQPQFERFAALVGHAEWVDDERFADPRARVRHGEALLALIRPLVREATTAEWCERLAAIDVLHAPVHAHADLLEDEQVRAVDALTWVEDPTLGRLPMAHVAGQPLPESGAWHTRAPGLGEHTDEVLAEIGFDAARIDAMVERGDAQRAAR